MRNQTSGAEFLAIKREFFRTWLWWLAFDGFKVKGNISFADCFAAAVAENKKATLVTGDPEFKQLENELSIAWL